MCAHTIKTQIISTKKSTLYLCTVIFDHLRSALSCKFIFGYYIMTNNIFVDRLTLKNDLYNENLSSPYSRHYIFLSASYETKD